MDYLEINKSNWNDKFGNPLLPLDPLSFKTKQSSTKSTKKLMKWLYDNAVISANNYYLKTLIKGIDLNNLSKSDMDTLNLIIFGEINVYLKFKKMGIKYYFK